MPDYKLRDPNTGYTLTLRGDSPPTEDEAEQAFAKAFPSTIPAPTAEAEELLASHPLGKYMFPQPAPSLAPQSDLGQPASLTFPAPEQEPAGIPGVTRPQTVEEYGPVVPWWDQPLSNVTKDPIVDAENPVHPVEKQLLRAFTGLAGPIIEDTIGWDKPAQVARSLYNLGAGTVDFMTTPKGAGLTLAAPFAPLAVSGYFAADMGLSAIEQEQELEKNWSGMTPNQRVDALTTLIGTGAFAGLAGKHTVSRVRRMAESPEYQADKVAALKQEIQGPILPEKFKAAPAPRPAQRDAATRMAQQRARDLKAESGFLLSEQDIDGPYRTSMRAVMEKYGMTAVEAAMAMRDARKHYAGTRTFKSTLDDTVVDMEDMFLLQELRDAGKITPEQSAALDAMESHAGVSGMETNEAQWATEKHQEAEAAGRGFVIEDHSSDPANAPFSPGSPMTINRSGSVVLDKGKLRATVESKRRAGLTEEQIESMLDASFQEELIHLATDRKTAEAYYNNASPREREQAARRYSFGRMGAESFPPDILGWEMIRYEIQKARGTPTEYTMIGGKELSDAKARDNIHDAITKIRNTIVTRGRGKETRRILDQVLENIERTTGKGEAPTAGEGKTPSMADRPDYKKHPKDRLEFDTKVNDAFAYVRQMHREGATDQAIKMEVDDFMKWISRHIIDSERILELPEFAAMHTPEKLKELKGGITGLKDKALGMLDWYESRDKGSFPAMPIKDYSSWKKEFDASLDEMVDHSRRWMNQYGIDQRQWPKNLTDQMDRLVERTMDLHQKFPQFSDVTQAPKEGESTARHGLDFVEWINKGGMQGKRLEFRDWNDLVEDIDRRITVTEGREEPLARERAEEASELVNARQELFTEYPEFSQLLSRIRATRRTPSMPHKPIGKKERERAEAMEKLRQMREAAGLIPKTSETEKAEQMAGAYEPATTPRPSPHAELTPKTAGEFVHEYFRTAEVLAEPVKAKDPSEHRVKREGPSFERFAGAFRLKFGPVDSTRLIDLFREHAAEALDRMPPARIAEIVKGMGLVQRVVGKGKPGERMLAEMREPAPQTGQLTLPHEAPAGRVERRRLLAGAEGRAQRAKSKESRYQGMLAEARQLHEDIRNFQRPEGYSSGPLWDVNEQGELVTRSGRLPSELEIPPAMRGKAIRLAELRKEMDEILYPSKQRQPEEREVEVEYRDPDDPAITIRETKLQKGPPELAPPAFQPGIKPKVKRLPGENTLITAKATIIHELLKQAEGSRRPLNRKEVTPEELGSARTSREPTFRPIRQDETSDVENLGRVLTEDSRSRPSDPANHTKRLVVLMNNETGQVVMVDIYRHPTRKGETMRVLVRNPGGVATHHPLSSVLKTHRPIYSVLLEDPITNLRMEYKSVGDFMDRFGNEARDRLRDVEYRDFTGEESEIPELEAGAEEGSGTMTRRARPGQLFEMSRPITDSEVGEIYDFISAGEGIKTMGDVGEAFREIVDTAARTDAPISERSLIATSALVKMMRHQMQQNPEMSAGDALANAARFIYESSQQRIEREWASENIPRGAEETAAQHEQRVNEFLRSKLVERTLARFGGKLAEPGPGPGATERAEAIRTAERTIQQQALEKARGVRTEPLPEERTVAPGTLPRTGESGAAESYDAEMRAVYERTRQEEAARKVREGEPVTRPREAFDPRQAKAIARAFRKEKADDTYFEKALKASSAAEAEITAELAREVPRKQKETSEEYIARVREWAEWKSEQAAAKELADQVGFTQSITEGGPTPGMPIKTYGKTLKNLTHDQVVKGMRIGSEWMVDRLRRVVPDTAVETLKHLDNANEIISRSQEYAGDMYQRFGDDALKASGKLGKDTTWMNEMQVVTPREGAIINSKEAIEGRLNPPDYAKDIVNTGQEANLLLGEFMERTSPGFIANGGMHNNLTAFGYDSIRDGPALPNWGKMVRANAEANADILSDLPRFKDKTREQIVDELRIDFDNYFSRYKRVLDNPASGPSDFFQLNQDWSRRWPRAITHIWTGKGPFGHWEPVIHSSMFSYFNHGIRRASMIRAFREFYPAEAAVDPETGFRTVGSALDQVMRDIRTEIPGQWQGLVNTLFRTLQGHPSENVTQTGWLSEMPLQRAVSIRQPSGVAMRVLQPVGDTLKTGMLSQQILLQPSELLTGASSIFFGYRKSALATWLNLRSRGQYDMLEAIGAVDRMMYDNAWEPNSKARSSFKLFNNFIRKYTGQNLFNEWQESQAAGAAYITAQRIMQANLFDATTRKPMGKLSWEDRNILPLTFRAMGFTHAEVGRMMMGDPQLLGQMVREAAAFTSGGHVHPSQQSRFLSNRATQGLFWFMRYPMTRQNQLLRMWQVIGEESAAGRKAEAAKAGLLLAKFIGGTSAQGILQGMIMTFFLAGGWAALRIKQEEAEDEPFSFLFDSFRSAMGGPLQFVTRGWEDSGLHGVAENFKRIAAPINIAGETYDAATGSGNYRDMSLFDRMGRFVSRRIPMSKAVKLGASTIGLSTDDPGLDAALTALNRWKRKEFSIYFKNLPAGGDDENKQFRMHMKQAVEAIRNNDTEAFLKARQEAVNAKLDTGKPLDESLESVGQSMLKRRVLTHPQTGVELTPEEMDALRQRIGGEAVDKLMSHDIMLKIQAGSF